MNESGLSRPYPKQYPLRAMNFDIPLISFNWPDLIEQEAGPRNLLCLKKLRMQDLHTGIKIDKIASSTNCFRMEEIIESISTNFLLHMLSRNVCIRYYLDLVITVVQELQPQQQEMQRHHQHRHRHRPQLDLTQCASHHHQHQLGRRCLHYHHYHCRHWQGLEVRLAHRWRHPHQQLLVLPAVVLAAGTGKDFRNYLPLEQAVLKLDSGIIINK